MCNIIRSNFLDPYLLSSFDSERKIPSALSTESYTGNYVLFKGRSYPAATSHPIDFSLCPISRIMKQQLTLPPRTKKTMFVKVVTDFDLPPPLMLESSVVATIAMPESFQLGNGFKGSTSGSIFSLLRG